MTKAGDGITLAAVNGKEVFVCDNCGAQAERKHYNRFRKRHPALCTTRQQFAKQLAAGTRSVDVDQAMESAEERLDDRPADTKFARLI